MKFDVYCTAVPTDMPAERMEFGNISASMAHETVPQVRPNAITNPLAHTRASGPVKPASCGAPLTMGAVPKSSARPPWVMSMPMDPTNSIGRRPTRSIRNVPPMVAAMLINDVMAVMVKESFSVKPTAPHKVLE